MRILGIAAFYHDSSACLVEDGRIIAACQEERLSRIKHDSGFPHQSIDFCLKQAGCGPESIDQIVFYEKPFLKFERLLETYLAFAPKGFTSFRKAIPLWLREKLFQKDLLFKELERHGFSKDSRNRLLFSSHHLSHAASAFFPSPFENSLILTMDGVGEWDTTTVYLGEGARLKKLKELRFPHSLGLLYSAFTYYCGFKVNSGEYKLMGLAPYGKPRFAELIKANLIDIKEDGSFKLNMSYFDYCTGLTMTNRKFENLFSFPPRQPEERIEQKHMDLAASIQTVLEEVVLKMCRHLALQHGQENLCLAGGVALNCVANGKIEKEKIFKKIWIQPAAGDAGGSLGAALAAYYLHNKLPRTVLFPDSMQGAYLGPQFSDAEIETFLKTSRASYTRIAESELYSTVTKELMAEKVVGWFQGRMEFGPRALGNRSILADPRAKQMQKNLNLKIKFRESFRPFAPAVLEEKSREWFELSSPSPYMLMVADVRPDKFSGNMSEIPAVTHVDGSARIQTINNDTNPKFYNLLKEFEKQTGTPLLVNTSFNIRNEPVVCTPDQAFRCFMGTHMDVLVMGNFLLHKQAQPPELAVDYQKDFKPD